MIASCSAPFPSNMDCGLDLGQVTESLPAQTPPLVKQDSYGPLILAQNIPEHALWMWNFNISYLWKIENEVMRKRLWLIIWKMKDWEDWCVCLEEKQAWR